MTNPKLQALVDRLRKIDTDPMGCGLANASHRNPDGPEAADAIVALLDRIERLEGALRPFASEAERKGWTAEHDRYSWTGSGLSYGDFRAARLALADPDEGGAIPANQSSDSNAP